jgi:hypothetical protein
MNFRFPDERLLSLKFRFALPCIRTMAGKEKGRMSGNLIRPLPLETQLDTSAISRATRFITAGVLLSTTTNQQLQTGEKNMTTSRKEASQAGKDLRNPNTPKRDRGPIASDLAQARRKPKK